jgi:hypothetical protein
MSSKYFVASLQHFASVQLRDLTVWDVSRRRLVAASSGHHVSLILNGHATQEEITKLD